MEYGAFAVAVLFQYCWVLLLGAANSRQVVTMLKAMSKKGKVELQDEKVQYAKCDVPVGTR